MYWDLLRIYDTNSHYAERMQAAATKLAEFYPTAPFTRDIVKKAEAFMKTAKNRTWSRHVVRASKSIARACFIADAAFADQPLALEPFLLRRFRDETLRTTKLGRRVIWTYYRVSPAWPRSSDGIRGRRRGPATSCTLARRLDARRDQRRL